MQHALATLVATSSAAGLSTNSHIISNFWHSADRQPPGHEEPLARLRELIVRTQQPASCNRVCTLTSAYHGGALADIRRLAYALMYAINNDCALVSLWPSYSKTNKSASMTTSAELRRRCSVPDRKGMRCYFLPPSPCAEMERPAAMAYEKSFALDRVFELETQFQKLHTKTGLHSEVLVMGTLLAWIMRPQPELRDAVEFYGSSLGFAEPGARHRRVALHIRHGDKHSLYARHMKNNSWRVSPRSFEAWGRRVAADLGLDRAVFMTDDPAAMDSLAPPHGGDGFFALAPAPRECLPSYAAGTLGKHAAPAVMMLMRLHRERESALVEKRAANISVACGPRYLVDDGIQLFAGVMLLAQAAAFVGTQISNVDAATIELMATLRFPPMVYDVLNDVHRACLSDEAVWYGGIHTHRRELVNDRLAGPDGTVAHRGLC